GDKTSELACGAGVDKILPAGTYYLAVDGNNADNFGKFTFDYQLKDVGTQEAACKVAPAINDGQTVNSTTTGGGFKFTTSCGGNEASQGSPDKLYKITVTGRTHARLSLSTPTWDGVLAIRKSCLEPDGSSGPRNAEVPGGCNNDSTDSHHSLVDTWLEAGVYFVVVTGHTTGNEGQFTL